MLDLKNQDPGYLVVNENEKATAFGINYELLRVFGDSVHIINSELSERNSPCDRANLRGALNYIREIE
jgi:hypothetical protein